MDVSSYEAAKVYIWTISVRLAGYSGEELTCVVDTLNRLYTAPRPMADEWAGYNAVERRVFLPRLIAVWLPALFCETFK